MRATWWTRYLRIAAGLGLVSREDLDGFPDAVRQLGHAAAVARLRELIGSRHLDRKRRQIQREIDRTACEVVTPARWDRIQLAADNPPSAADLRREIERHRAAGNLSEARAAELLAELAARERGALNG